MKNIIILFSIFLLMACFSIDNAVADSKLWCKDDATACWSPERDNFSGIRFVFEPQLGIPIALSNDNRIKPESFQGMPKFAIDLNLWKEWVALQGGFMWPVSVELDPNSDLVKRNYTSGNRVGTQYGAFGGLTFINGILAIGYGQIKIDTFSLTQANYDKSLYENFIYITIQPISAVRAYISKGKK